MSMGVWWIFSWISYNGYVLRILAMDWWPDGLVFWGRPQIAAKNRRNSPQRTETAFSLNKGALKYDNAVKTIINHSFGNGVYHPFMVILGMVYYCLKHLRILHKSGQHTTRFSRSMNIQSSCAARHPQEDLLHPAPTPAWSRFAILGWQVDQKVPAHITGWFVTNEKNISHKWNVYKCYTFMVREA